MSETWLIEGDVFTDAVNELKYKAGIEAICVNRKATSGRNTGGGAAILYKKNKISLKPYPFRREGCELVAAKGRISGDNRPLYVIAAYLPPSMKKKLYEKYCQALRSLLMNCLLYTSPSPRDRQKSRMPSSA